MTKEEVRVGLIYGWAEEMDRTSQLSVVSVSIILMMGLYKINKYINPRRI